MDPNDAYDLEQEIKTLNKKLEASREQNVRLENEVKEILIQATDVRLFGTCSQT